MSDISNVTPVPAAPMPEPKPEDKPIEPVVPEIPPEPTPEPKPDGKPEDKPDGDPDKLELPEVKDPEEYERGFEDTGSEYINSALETMEQGGVDLEKAFGKVFETNDPNDIDMDYLNEKLGKVAAFGLIEGLKAENSKIEEYAKTESTRVHTVVDGKENWDAIMSWIGSGESGLTSDGRDSYNDMLRQGGVPAELAAKELYNMFKQSPGFKQIEQTIPGEAPGTPGQLEPISRAEYSSEYDKIFRAEGANSPKLAVLDKRRLATLVQ